MLVDSNIIIYAAKAEHTTPREFLPDQSPAVSAISYVEVLGYHRLTQQDRLDFGAFFASTSILDLSGAILERAVNLRQTRKMGLADSLIAATALSHNLTLVTRNTKDFHWIAGLAVLDPFQ
jgi:toxin FitB